MMIKHWKIRINSDDDLSLKKTLLMHNVMIFVRLVFNNENKYYS